MCKIYLSVLSWSIIIILAQKIFHIFQQVLTLCTILFIWLGILKSFSNFDNTLYNSFCLKFKLPPSHAQIYQSWYLLFLLSLEYYNLAIFNHDHFLLFSCMVPYFSLVEVSWQFSPNLLLGHHFCWVLKVLCKNHKSCSYSLSSIWMQVIVLLRWWNHSHQLYYLE